MSILTDKTTPVCKSFHQPNMCGLFSMYAQVPVDNYADIRNPVELHKNTQLYKAYYSPENMSIIQNGIRAGVYTLSKEQYVISPQDPTVIAEVMHSVFTQNVRGQSADITNQINTLNKEVIGYCADAVFASAKNYIRFIGTTGKVVTPMAHPIMSTVRDSRTYVLPVGIKK